MKVYSKEEFQQEKPFLFQQILKGALFIYPTDTIYGIGCDATNYDSVKKIRESKERYMRPFSIIVPSKEWIYKNCILTDEADEWIRKLPGPYTLILKLKKKECIAPNVNTDLDTLGIRIPDNWFTKHLSELEVPIVTTSANIVGENFMTSLDDLNPKIQAKTDFAVYEGEKKGRPSNIIDLTDELKIIER